jgi:hypothetical protein
MSSNARDCRAVRHGRVSSHWRIVVFFEVPRQLHTAMDINESDFYVTFRVIKWSADQPFYHLLRRVSLGSPGLAASIPWFSLTGHVVVYHNFRLTILSKQRRDVISSCTGEEACVWFSLTPSVRIPGATTHLTLSIHLSLKATYHAPFLKYVLWCCWNLTVAGRTLKASWSRRRIWTSRCIYFPIYRTDLQHRATRVRNPSQLFRTSFALRRAQSEARP